MGWTYSGDPGGSSKDAVRFLLQDVNTSKQIVQDEEIEWVLTQEMNVYMTAAAIADILVARAGAVKSKKISEFSITYDPSFYKHLSLSLRARGSSYQIPYAGGISQSDKLAQQQDSDWVAPAISRNLDNNPDAPSPATPPVNSMDPPLTSI